MSASGLQRPLVAQSSGTTWMDRLNLEPTPFAVAYDTDFSWDFTFVSGGPA